MTSSSETLAKSNTPKSRLTVPEGVAWGALTGLLAVTALLSVEKDGPPTGRMEYGLQSAQVTANRIAEKGIITLTGQPFTDNNGRFTSMPGKRMNATLSECKQTSDSTLMPIYTSAMGKVVLGTGEMVENTTILQRNAIYVDEQDFICYKLHFSEDN